MGKSHTILLGHAFLNLDEARQDGYKSQGQKQDFRNPSARVLLSRSLMNEHCHLPLASVFGSVLRLWTPQLCDQPAVVSRGHTPSR
jgi:hypothetical protein